jgi:peptidoglycan/xylan/chitin deacetylase (PgdA/CDA1 family)
MKFLRMIRHIIFFLLYPFARLTSKRYVPVLAYHSVDNNNSFFSVTPNEFVRQMEYLRRNYMIVSLHEVLEFVMGRRELPRKSVAITADDGYQDNYLNVYPYAKTNGLQIAIFVASGYVGKEMMLGNIPLKMLNWKEIAEMSRDKVTIGAHTVNHRDLRVVDNDEARSQILISKTSIEEAIGQPIGYFAYPFGACAAPLFALLKSLGFKAGFATGDGLVSQGDNPYELKRITIDSSVSFFIFKAKLTLATEWYNGIERTAKSLAKKFPFCRALLRSEMKIHRNGQPIDRG